MDRPAFVMGVNGSSTRWCDSSVRRDRHRLPIDDDAQVSVDMFGKRGRVGDARGQGWVAESTGGG